MRGTLTLMTLLLAGCICGLPLVTAESSTSEGISKAIPNPEPLDELLVESFLDIDGEKVGQASAGVQLSWWPWSDETGSDWPDDDAKARIGQLGLAGEAGTLYNGQLDPQTAQSLNLQDAVIELEGSIELVLDENGAIAIAMPVSFTPLVNLSDSTVLSILISEDRAVDHHGRVAQHLVRDMMPQVGFSVQVNNTTHTTWNIPSTHLSAAGIDLDDQPHGWHITLAFFGDVEGGEETRLLALYNTPIPTSWDGASIGNFFVPIFIILLCAVVASGSVMGSFKREKGMPKIDAQWLSSDPPTLQFRILAGTQPLSLNGCDCTKPWAIRGGFKRVNILAGKHHEFTIRFKRHEDVDCHISLSVEVEELGAWTQYLRLASPQQTVRSVEVEGDEPSNGDDT